MEDVGLGEVNGEVGIGVGGIVVGELEGVLFVGEVAVAVEEDGRKRADWARLGMSASKAAMRWVEAMR